MPSMCTGPAVSSRTRLAIRNASTTPWQYPRGVILTTFMAVLRVYAGGSIGRSDSREQVALRQLRSRFAARELVVLGAERQPVDLVGHGREPRVGIVLAHVRRECGSLAVDEVADVDLRRHQLVRSAHDPDAIALLPRFLRHLINECLHERPGDGGVVELSRAPSFLLEKEGWSPRKLYYTAIPRSLMQAFIDQMPEEARQ